MPRVLPIELKEFDATTLDGTDQDFGSVFSNPAIKICIINTSDVDCYVDCDTVVPFRMRSPAGSAITFDESTLYFRGVDQEYYLPKGSQLTVTQVTAPASEGNIICHVVTRIIA